MKFFIKWFERSAAVFLLIALSLCGLVSCRESAAPYSMMLEFCKSYGISGTVFSPCVKEGESGYTDEDFFDNVFGGGSECVSDYAIVFVSNLNAVGECAVFSCYTEYDALVSCDAMSRRIDLIKTMGASIDTSYAFDAVVFKSGKYAVMCVLPDNALAERIWRKIL